MSIELTKKIIFSGPMGAGKTTAITAISEIDPIKSDVKNNDTDLHGKTMTTMAMDYGMVTLEDG
ncbi:MAG: GTP-binding protein, partial [Pseudomonadales bacterium]|nr:GTP-binding protein [Pseudomonadales bacterium]